MEKKVMSKEYMLNNREEILAKYNKVQPKSRKNQLLSKKERKVLGVGRDKGVAHAKYVRIAPRKVDVVLKLIKDKSLAEAYGILRYTPKAASGIIAKTIKSAESNAVNNNELSAEGLYVAECYANQGPTLKRIMPRARGSASRINKRTTHITIVLKERK